MRSLIAETDRRAEELKKLVAGVTVGSGNESEVVEKSKREARALIREKEEK